MKQQIQNVVEAIKNFLDPGRDSITASQILATDNGQRFPESDYIKKKRREAISMLGKNWVLHPEYRPHPRHSNHIHIWWPHSLLRRPGERVAH